MRGDRRGDRSGRSTFARCAAPGDDAEARARDAVGQRVGVARGGVAGSSRPAISRVGAVIAASRPVRSKAASASQQAAYASGSAARGRDVTAAPVNPG